MSARNGDKSRFQINRKRRLLHRQRIQALAARLQSRTDAAATQNASLAMQSEGGPARTDA